MPPSPTAPLPPPATAPAAAAAADRTSRAPATLILLSNREPYEHVRDAAAGGTTTTVRQPPGGLVSALDPTMRRMHGVWVAWGSGSGDRETADADGRLQVPPDAPAYTLRRVWLDEADIDGYYLGFANSALWPLCHLLLQHYRFASNDWERYVTVNARFASAIADEARRAAGQPAVWVQDYHFALVPALLRADLPDVFIHQFWHIPFPPPDIIRFLPHDVRIALLHGLLGNDLIEFHTDRYAVNFLACVADGVADAEVDSAGRRVRWQGRATEVGVFPISIDVARYDAMARADDGAARAAELRERFAGPGRQLGVSVDRVDYTKGIPERLRALDRLWEMTPALREHFTMLVVATPSRIELEPYRALAEEVAALVDEINERYATDSWVPIVYMNENVDAPLLASIYRAADLCLVSSLQDGMNLVAKEFVACQVEERGVLVLSRFAGAADEIDGAVLINPFNVDGFAAGIASALAMDAEERGRRMRAMRAQLADATIFDWLDAILARAGALMARAASAPDESLVPDESPMPDESPVPDESLVPDESPSPHDSPRPARSS